MIGMEMSEQQAPRRRGGEARVEQVSPHRLDRIGGEAAIDECPAVAIRDQP